MQGTNRTIAPRLLTRLLLGAFLAVALTTGTATAKKPPRIKGGKTFVLPWETRSPSVAIAPDGTAWFGADAPASLSLVAVRPTTGMTVENLDPNRELVTGRTWGTTDDLHFAPNGDLWFARRAAAGERVVRRAPDGTETTFELPGDQPVVALAIGPEGDPWLVRGYRTSPAITHLTQTGTATTFFLGFRSLPTSIVTGPDGNLWFTEEGSGRIGRISPGGEIHLFQVGRDVHPREIVAGADGDLWFSENGLSGPGAKPSDRIGRITTAGKYTQFAIPFGHGTERLAADPRGPIWFSTQRGEISSISPRGAIGARGCVDKCSLVYSLAVAPEGTLWFAAAKRYEPCLECGGGTAILQQLEGAPVREIPAGALAPAPKARPSTDSASEASPHVTVKTRSAYGVEETEALLAGFINPHGRTATFRFQWGTTTRYGHVTYAPEEPVYPGYKGEEVEEFIFDLKPGTVYHFRVIAYSHGRKFYGQDETFKTLPFHSQY